MLFSLSSQIESSCLVAGGGQKCDNAYRYIHLFEKYTIQISVVCILFVRSYFGMLAVLWGSAVHQEQWSFSSMLPAPVEAGVMSPGTATRELDSIMNELLGLGLEVRETWGWHQFIFSCINAHFTAIAHNEWYQKRAV